MLPPVAESVTVNAWPDRVIVVSFDGTHRLEIAPEHLRKLIESLEWAEETYRH